MWGFDLGRYAHSALSTPTYDMHCTCCVSPATNTVYHLCTYSLELLCSCSHAGGDTLTWLNIWWRWAGAMLELWATVVPHRYTGLASKFLLIVLCLSTAISQVTMIPTAFMPQYDMKVSDPFRYTFTKSGLANCVSHNWGKKHLCPFLESSLNRCL